MRNQLYIWVTLVLAVCTGRASAQEEERIAQAFERLGAIVKRDDAKPNKPVIGLRFGLRNPIPDTTPEIIKDYILDTVDVYIRMGRDGPQKDAAKPLDPNMVIKVTDADLNEVSKLENLETLDLSFGEITNQALEHIKGLKKLKTLDLRKTQVNDAGLAMLQELPNLKHLYLTGCPITDDGLIHVQKLNPESLYVGGFSTKVTDKGIPHLKGLVTDKGMRHLKGLKSLRSLHLQHARGVTDEGLQELKELTNLRELNLFNTEIKGKGLEYLSKLKELQTLDLRVDSLTDDSLKHLAELKRLEVLYLSSDKVTDESLKHLSGLKDLKTLNLHGTGVTDEGMKTLLKLENLRQLCLRNTRVTDKGVKQLKGLKKLERLDLMETPCKWTGVTEIQEALPKLEIGPIPQFPDWYNIYMENQRLGQFPDPQFAVHPPIMNYRVLEESHRSRSGLSDLPGWLCPAILGGAAAAAAAAGRRKRAQ
jgi:Leucine-rich repeat (LRR) protein